MSPYFWKVDRGALREDKGVRIEDEGVEGGGFQGIEMMVLPNALQKAIRDIHGREKNNMDRI